MINRCVKGSEKLWSCPGAGGDSPPACGRPERERDHEPNPGRPARPKPAAAAATAAFSKERVRITSRIGLAQAAELHQDVPTRERGNEGFPGHEAFNFEIGKLFRACLNVC